MNDYTVVVTYMNGTYRVYSDQHGDGWRSPVEALAAFMKAYPDDHEEILHVEVVHAVHEFAIYDRCEQLGLELADLRKYDLEFAKKLFPERFEDAPVEVIKEVATAVEKVQRPTLQVIRGGKRRWAGGSL